MEDDAAGVVGAGGLEMAGMYSNWAHDGRGKNEGETCE
jgi:hypothetical protein